MQNFEKEFGEFLRKNRNPKRAKKEKEYLYSDLVHYGIPSPIRAKFVQKYKKEFLLLDKAQAIKMAKLFWNKPSFEEKSVALHVLNLHKDSLTISEMPLIEKLMREAKGWALLDNLIIPIMPSILSRESSVYEYLERWIKDDDFWVRRSALLAQILFFRENKGGRKKLFFRLAKSQFDESWIEERYPDSLPKKRARFFIRKAIGWSVREISLKDPQTAFEFLKENKNKMSGLSYRDGKRRLPVSFQKKLEFV